MGWQEAVGTLLATDSVISTLIASGEAVSPGYITDDIALPHIHYTQLDNPKIDDDGQSWIRLRIFIRSMSFSQCETIRERIDPIFNNGFGTIAGFDFANTKLIAKGQSPVFDEQTKRYETYSDVRLSYKDQ